MDVIENSNGLFLVLKCFEERSLKELLDYDAGIDLRDSCDLLRDIGCILEPMHAMGIAHRKLTLDSIRMRRKGDKAIAIIDGMDLAIQLAPA